MANTKLAPHCVMINGGMRCLHCGDLHQIPYPIATTAMCTMLDSFALRHATCKNKWTPPVHNPAWSITERIKWWLSVGEIGMSAATIYNRFMNMHRLFGIDECHPSDPDDFRRCYLLLRVLPEWRSDLGRKMKPVSIVWSNLVDNWDTLTTMLEKLMAAGPETPYTEMYELMKKLGC